MTTIQQTTQNITNGITTIQQAATHLTEANTFLQGRLAQDEVPDWKAAKNDIRSTLTLLSQALSSIINWANEQPAILLEIIGHNRTLLDEQTHQASKAELFDKKWILFGTLKDDMDTVKTEVKTLTEEVNITKTAIQTHNNDIDALDQRTNTARTEMRTISQNIDHLEQIQNTFSTQIKETRQLAKEAQGRSTDAQNDAQQALAKTSKGKENSILLKEVPIFVDKDARSITEFKQAIDAYLSDSGKTASVSYLISRTAGNYNILLSDDLDLKKSTATIDLFWSKLYKISPAMPATSRHFDERMLEACDLSKNSITDMACKLRRIQTEWNLSGIPNAPNAKQLVEKFITYVPTGSLRDRIMAIIDDNDNLEITNLAILLKTKISELAAFKSDVKPKQEKNKKPQDDKKKADKQGKEKKTCIHHPLLSSHSTEDCRIGQKKVMKCSHCSSMDHWGSDCPKKLLLLITEYNKSIEEKKPKEDEEFYLLQDDDDCSDDEISALYMVSGEDNFQLLDNSSPYNEDYDDHSCSDDEISNIYMITGEDDDFQLLCNSSPCNEDEETDSDDERSSTPSVLLTTLEARDEANGVSRNFEAPLVLDMMARLARHLHWAGCTTQLKIKDMDPQELMKARRIVDQIKRMSGTNHNQHAILSRWLLTIDQTLEITSKPHPAPVAAKVTFIARKGTDTRRAQYKENLDPSTSTIPVLTSWPTILPPSHTEPPPMRSFLSEFPPLRTDDVPDAPTTKTLIYVNMILEGKTSSVTTRCILDTGNTSSSNILPLQVLQKLGLPTKPSASPHRFRSAKRKKTEEPDLTSLGDTEIKVKLGTQWITMPFQVLDTVDIPILSQRFIQSNKGVISWRTNTLSIILNNIDMNLPLLRHRGEPKWTNRPPATEKKAPLDEPVNTPSSKSTTKEETVTETLIQRTLVTPNNTGTLFDSGNLSALHDPWQNPYNDIEVFL